MNKELRNKRTVKFFKKIWDFVSRHNALVIALEIAIFIGIVFVLAAGPAGQELGIRNYELGMGEGNQESGITNQELGIKKENLEELKIKEVEPQKYAFKSLEGDVIEIGTERHSPFQPYLKLNKWDGEVSLKVNIPFTVDEMPVLDGNKIRYSSNKVDIEFYPKQPEEIIEKDEKGNEHTFTINEQGGVEFDTILYEKPETNKIVFPIETQGLKFYYQPELTQKEKDEGAFRPENVVGSYAVYHESKSGDYTALGGKNYMAGKAFHIYRPKIHDADGNWTWGQLAINNQQLTITIDQDWLNNAIYPVTIDPNFGYETAGTTGGLVSGDWIRACRATGAGGTGNSITVYFPDTVGVSNAKCALYDNSSPSNIVTNGTTEEYDPSTGWNIFNFATAPSLDSVIYNIGCWTDNEGEIAYDSKSGWTTAHYGGATYPTWPTDVTWSTYSDTAVSIYATYTPITYDAKSSSSSSSTSSLSWSHTIGSGPNRILVVGVSTNSQTVSSVTYDGTGLISIGSVANGSNARVEMWKMLEANLPSAGSYNIIVTLGGSAAVVAGATSWSGIDQTTPHGTFTFATGDDDAISVNVSSAGGEMVVDTATSDFQSVGVAGAGQTQRWNLNPSVGLGGGGSSEPGETTVTMSWAAFTTVNWAIGAVSLKPETGGAARRIMIIE